MRVKGRSEGVQWAGKALPGLREPASRLCGLRHALFLCVWVSAAPSKGTPVLLTVLSSSL